MAEIEPVELTEPVDVVAWLRALPVGTVLLDGRGRAWQLRAQRTTGRSTFLLTGSTSPYRLAAIADMRAVAKSAPFRVLWTPGGGA